ncbi:hypothetical protein [Hyalangium versicolor]|uniref:hypothetical protein n=1 Tax=Hyalangium versicolor TaxID=2861190 RepID=UPI001CC9F410|nr:hypothetical protein [Hyalangium versicolor]
MAEETSPEDAEAIERARATVFRVLERDLERQGTPEAVQYLQYLIQARPEAVERKGTYKRVTFGMHQRISEYSTKYSPVTGAQNSWLFPAFAERCGRGLTKAQALEVAQKVAQPPEDAVLEVADYEEQAGEAVFVARWGHVVNGVRVERDYIQVLVNGALGRAFALHRKWHTVDEEPSWR